MRQAKVIRSDGRTLLERCGVVETPGEAMTGLLSRASLAPDEGLWFPRHSSVHTFFMPFAIDVAFLDHRGKVIAQYHGLRPWRHTWIHLRSLRGGILEASAGMLARAAVKEGEELRLCPST